MTVTSHQVMAWLSPSFPTGAFAYSHGLEQAIYDGLVHDADSLKSWLETLLLFGAARNDAILLSRANKGDDVADLAEALAGSRERHEETLAQGRAFARTASVLLHADLTPAALPVVLGRATAVAGIPLPEILPLYLHAFTANLVSAAVRLVPLGQTDGQVVLQALFPVMDQLAEEAVDASVEDLGTCAFGSDLAAMKHEDMTTRIFKS